MHLHFSSITSEQRSLSVFSTAGCGYVILTVNSVKHVPLECMSPTSGNIRPTRTILSCVEVLGGILLGWASYWPVPFLVLCRADNRISHGESCQDLAVSHFATDSNVPFFVSQTIFIRFSECRDHRIRPSCLRAGQVCSQHTLCFVVA